MRKIEFGTLRFIELFDDTDIVQRRNYDRYITSFKLDEEIGSDFTVIGSINGMEPIIKIKKTNINPIVIYSSTENRLIIVATDEDNFTEILNRISEVWKGYSAEMFIPKNTETIARYRQFKEWILAHHGIAYGYWIDFAFKEFDIRYEV
jgi:hypothetical protein